MVDNKKLKALLYAQSDEGERKELERLDVEKIKEIQGFFNASEKEHQRNYDKLIASFQAHVKNSEEYFTGLTKKIGDVLGTLTTSYERNKPDNASGDYKDMINQISAVKESIDKKPVPVWNWPQYAGVSVRNKNFSNINPAVDSFGIGDYDQFLGTYDGANNLTVAKFELTGNLVATLNLTYDAQSNVVNVVKI